MGYILNIFIMVFFLIALLVIATNRAEQEAKYVSSCVMDGNRAEDCRALLRGERAFGIKEPVWKK